ncbi:MAG: V-type ATP synthase subunit I [Bacilli bacterium]|nr:V-type ATP synthase subunit I [Bacilli bacterium]
MIAPMKKAKIVFLKEDKDAVLKALQRIGELMVIKTEESSETLDSSKDEVFVQRTQRSLQVIKPYTGKKKPFGIGEYCAVNYKDFVNPDYHGNQEILDEIEKADSEIAKLKAENDSAKEFIGFLAPWDGLEGKLSNIYSSKYTTIHTGFIPLKLVEDFKKQFENFESDLKQFQVASDTVAFMLVNWREDDASIMDQIKGFGFMEVSLPNEEKTLKELVAEKQQKIDANLAKISEIEEELKKYASKEQEIKIFSDQMETQKVLKETPVVATVDTIYLEGWVKKNKADKIKKAIESATDTYDLEIVDAEEGEAIPTALENPKLISNFEPITDMFSRPNSKEIDPNPVMSFWYWIIFGLMMADFGYGAVLAIGTFLALKFLKPRGTLKKLMKVFFLGSITTMIWGIIFGSYFGAEFHPLWFVPSSDPISMLILSLVLGVVHLSCGLIIKAVSQIRDGHLLDAIFDQFSWILVMVGLSLSLSQFCANMLPTSPVIPPIVMTVGYIIAGVGAVIILFTAGREKKNIFGKVVGGLLGLYGVTGYLSDILSYARILALCMSSAIVAYVMNLLAGMVGANGVIGFIFSLFIYLAGHVFNLAMGLLSTYVHDSRLQYIEFFGKFYEGGGVDFKPLALEYKYVNEINDVI